MCDLPESRNQPSSVTSRRPTTSSAAIEATATHGKHATPTTGERKHCRAFSEGPASAYTDPFLTTRETTGHFSHLPCATQVHRRRQAYVDRQTRRVTCRPVVLCWHRVIHEVDFQKSGILFFNLPKYNFNFT
ncbi:hypothetical protein MANES_09G077209v8 [Manihot esculenta]|uniref:Uncharacterized protein n=1 Tax=Manihot esculenta TaxID=3983 RepID=A0ACB7H423_MANES|nr:hypothetical protein MANES_09G077209v8 [Manihot esculenta]